MNLQICKKCKGDELYFCYQLIPLKDFREFLSVNKVNNIDIDKDKLFYIEQSFCTSSIQLGKILFDDYSRYDNFFLYVYQKNLLQYFLIRNTDIQMKYFNFIKYDKKDKLYFSKSDKILSSKDRNKVLTGVKMYLNSLQVINDCNYYVEHNLFSLYFLRKSYINERR